MAALVLARVPRNAAARTRPRLATPHGSSDSPSPRGHYPTAPTTSAARHHAALVACRPGLHLQHLVAFVHMALPTPMLLAAGRLFPLSDCASSPLTPSFRNRHPRTPRFSAHTCSTLAGKMAAPQLAAHGAAVDPLAPAGDSITPAHLPRVPRPTGHGFPAHHRTLLRPASFSQRRQIMLPHDRTPRQLQPLHTTPTSCTVSAPTHGTCVHVHTPLSPIRASRARPPCAHTRSL